MYMYVMFSCYKDIMHMSILAFIKGWIVITSDFDVPLKQIRIWPGKKNLI